MSNSFSSLIDHLTTTGEGSVDLFQRRVLLFDAATLALMASRFIERTGPLNGVEHLWNFGFATGFQFAISLQNDSATQKGDVEWIAASLSMMSLRGFADFELREASFNEPVYLEVSFRNAWHDNDEIKKIDHSEYFDAITTGMLSGCASAVSKVTVIFVTKDPSNESLSETLAIGRNDWDDEDADIKELNKAVEDITNEPFSFAEHLERTSPTVESIRDLVTEIETRNQEIQRMQRHIEQLQEVVYDAAGPVEMLGRSAIYNKALRNAEKVAESPTTVLLLGETGTGKEMFARFIHNNSPQKHLPLIIVNCAALPESLVESELFGHEKGAFTGANSRRLGRFEIANNTTIFLDEVGELPLETQAKFLRVLQEGEFERLGGSQTIKVNTRVIAATNRDLAQLVDEGRFRADLFYRLSVFPITVPSLRQRQNDIVLLTNFFVQQYNRVLNKKITSIDRHSLDKLKAYSFPGNIRELKHIIERAVLLSDGDVLYIETPQSGAPTVNLTLNNTQVSASQKNLTLREMERQYILSVLENCNGVIAGKGGAAEILDLPPSTLRSKMEKLGIL